MKILVVTPACHFKNSGATQNDMYALLGHLRNLGHDIVLYTLDSPKQDKNTLNKVASKYNVPVETFEPDTRSMTRWILRLFKEPALFDRAAYVFDILARSNDFKNFVARWRPDAIISFCSFSWPVLRFAKENNIRGVFRSHVFEANFFWQELLFYQKLLPYNWFRFLAKWQGEKKAITFAKSTGTLLASEMSHYRAWKKEGVHDLTLMFPAFVMREPWVHKNKKPLDVFYLGASYNIIFHLRGAELLIKKIVPEVLKKATGEFRFHILGSKLPDYLVELCNQKDIIYEGYVPDLDLFLQNMDIGAFPVFTGTTMKGKVFDSLTRAFPVVISPVGTGEYKITTEKEVLIATDIKDFVTGIMRLRDDNLRYNLSSGAHQFTKNIFGKETIERVLTELLGGNTL